MSLTGSAATAQSLLSRRNPKFPCLKLEQSLWQQQSLRVVGVDEAGLGSLAGPVVAAAVLLPPHCGMLENVRDSKLLSKCQRERLFEQILQQAIGVGVGMATVQEIEQVNVLQASYLAMQRALKRVAPYDHALIDGRPIRQVDLGCHTEIIDGDASSYAIACASIVAKVRRDRLMTRLAQRYPGYGWQKNMGYGTQQHRQALQQQGITPHHRRSYAPVRQVLQQLHLFDEPVVQTVDESGCGAVDVVAP